MQQSMLSSSDAAYLIALQATALAPPSARCKGSAMTTTDGEISPPEQSLITALTTIAGSVGKIEGTQASLQSGINNLQGLMAASEVRRAEDRADVALKFEHFGKVIEVLDHRLGIVERFTITPDETKHLTPSELVDVRKHIVDEEQHLAPAERALTNRSMTRWDRRWKIGAQVVGAAVSLTVIVTFVATHWPFH